MIPIINLILLSIIIIIIIYAGLYIYSLSKISVKSVDINRLQDISISGFTLGGTLQVYNGGLVPIGIHHISYNVELEVTSEQLSQGNIQGSAIPSGSLVKYPISSKINWIPSVELALNLIKGGNTYAKISGIVYITDLKIIDIKVPFKLSVDIGSYIRQFIKNKI